MYLVRSAKGLTRFVVDEALGQKALEMHVSEVEPGSRAHAPHTHEGIEAFYVLSGKGVLEVGEERLELESNEAVVFNPMLLHGLANEGEETLRYLVVLSRAG